MSISLVHKSDIIRAVPERWAQQYSRSHYGQDKQSITLKLKALPDGFTAQQVDEIIGNGSWTECRCDECGLDRDILVRIGAEPDYDARWQDLCADCLRAALSKVTTDSPAPRFVHPAFPYENPRTPAETEAMLNHMADVHLTPTDEKGK